MKKTANPEADKSDTSPKSSKADGKSSEDIKKEMAANAAIIQAGREPKVEVAPAIVVIPSKRPVQELISEWVTYGEGQVSLTVKEGMPVEEWASVLAFHCDVQEHVGFLIGDLIQYGTSHFGEKYSAAMAALGKEYKTLVNWVSTAKAVPPEIRRKELSYSVHAEVAGLAKHFTNDKGQVLIGALQRAQRKLLAKAVVEKLSVAAMREEVKKLVDEQGAKKGEPTTSTGTATPAASTPSGTADLGAGVSTAFEFAESNNVSATTSEDRLKNDAAIEKADSLQTYFRSPVFADLSKEDKAQWMSILKPLVDVYENLLDTLG